MVVVALVGFAAGTAAAWVFLVYGGTAAVALRGLSVDWNSAIVQALAAFVAGAVFQALLAFALDEVRAARAERREEAREEARAQKQRWLETIAGTEASCRATVSWLMAKALGARDEMPYYQRLVSQTRNVDASLLGAAGVEYARACNELFKLKLGEGSPSDIPAKASHALLVATKALDEQRERVHQGLAPNRASAEVAASARAEAIEFIEGLLDRMDELTRQLTLEKAGVVLPRKPPTEPS